MKYFRSDFPIFTNNRELVYLDSAATSQKPQCVIDAVNDFYTTYNSNIHRGLYPIAERATETVELVRRNTADFIHAKNEAEIVFTQGTTLGINMIAYGLKKFLKKGDVILITELEHHSNIIPWQKIAKETQATLLYIGLDKNGLLRNEIIDATGKTIYTTIGAIAHLRIISLSHVSNVLGTIIPIKQIIKEVKKMKSSPFVVIDAAQSVAHMPIDVQDLACDFLVFSGHKIFAPSGIGVMYGKKEILDQMEPFLVGSQMIREVTKHDASFRDTPQKFEPGTLPLEGILGLGAAIEYLQRVGYTAIQTHERKLLDYCIEKLSEIQGLRIIGPQNSKERSSIIAFTIDGIHPHDIAQILGEQNICIRAGHHCAMLLHTRLGTPASARISFSVYNAKEDVDKLISGLNTVRTLLRKNIK